MKCGKCGFETSEHLEFCPICGGSFYSVQSPTVSSENTKTCPFCGSTLRIEAMFCNNCGKALEAPKDAPKCEKCGSPIKENSAFCGVCGNPVAGSTRTFVPPVPTPPAYPSSAVAVPKKNSKGTVIWIIVLVVIILALGGVIAFLLINNNNNNQPPAPTPTPTQTVEPSNNKDDDIDDEEDVDYEEDNEEDDIYLPAIPPSQNQTFPTARPIPQDGYNVPSFVHISASSIREPINNNYYNAANAYDGRFDTAWTEGVDGDGLGESLSLFASEEQLVSGIHIANGYWKSEKLYYENNRISELQISLSNGNIYTYILSDVFENYDTIIFSSPQYCSSITLTILDVYKGSKYDDTCITEVLIF